MNRWSFLFFLISCCGLWLGSATHSSQQVQAQTALETLELPNGRFLLNRYTRVTSDIRPGDNQLRVANLSELNRDAVPYLPPNIQTPAGTFATNTLAPGDLIMLYQAQGAEIDTVEQIQQFGRVTQLNGAGNYEFVVVSEVQGNLVLLTCGVEKTYVANANVQAIRVPRFRNLRVSAGAEIVSIPWGAEAFAPGSSPESMARRRGGVIAVEADNVEIEGQINAVGAGFRGGIVNNLTSAADSSFWTALKTRNAARGAMKGESVAGWGERYNTLFGGQFGRGAIANGGGGGNAHNAGGGGGSNGGNPDAWFRGAGVMNDFGSCGSPGAWALDPNYIANGNRLTNSSGGGHGGYTFTNINLDACTNGPSYPANFIAPGIPAQDVFAPWNRAKRDAVGGLGGRPLALTNPENTAYLGGGGGAGEGNNSAAGDGGAGGGFILLLANQVTGNGTITADGAPGGNTRNTHLDAAGGGGGGGTIVVQADRLENGLRLSANGGRGGDQLILLVESEGPGGGGGGGRILLNVRQDNANKTVNGGRNGVTSSVSMTEFPANGATSGNSGSIATFTRTIGLSDCADLAIAKVLEQPNQLLAVNDTVAFQIILTNLGLKTASSIEVRENPGSGLALLSAVPERGTYTAPFWRLDSLAVGDTVRMRVTARIRSTGNYLNEVQVSAATNDPDPTNNVASVLPALANALIATDDDYRNFPASSGGGRLLPFSILENDQVNGVVASPESVTFRLLNPPPFIRLNAAGVPEILPGAPPGAYSVSYEICERANPANCRTAQILFLVVSNLIEAQDIDFGTFPLNHEGFIGIATANDRLNGIPIRANEFTFTLLDAGGLVGISQSPDGELFLLPGLNPAGTYLLSYRICETNDPANCDEATILLRLEDPPIDVSILKVSEQADAWQGETLVYRITASNLSPVSGTQVRIEDILPNSLRFISQEIAENENDLTLRFEQENERSLSWTIDEFPAFSTVTIRLTVEVRRAADNRPFILQNTASIAVEQEETNVANNSSTSAVIADIFFIPDIIIPNNSGRNDTWRIRGLARFPSNRVVIFNRWGDHVFEMTNYNNSWNAPGLVSGTYYYILTVTTEEGEERNFKGWIQVNQAP
ncbi:MAG: T9SS type B sorting domain-containing protein [Nitritalea sp.]